MHPIILTKEMKVLVIGGGQAAKTKLNKLLQCYSDITCLSIGFKETIIKSHAKCIEGNFYTQHVDFFLEYDIIYLSLPYPNERPKQDFFMDIVSQLISRGKLLSVSSKPELGNFITPATRTDGRVTVCVTTAEKYPKRSVELAERFIKIVNTE